MQNHYELIYQLKLPPVTEFLNDGVFEKLFIGKNQALHRSFSAKEVIKPEWLSLKGINWTQLVLFYKPDYQGLIIHSDDNKTNRQIDEECIWGINFVYGGYGITEYWQSEDVNILEGTRSNSIGTYYTRCEVNKPAYKTYTMEHNGAYLVNASPFHRVKGVGPRYALVMRPDNSCGFTWPKLVELFGDLIV